MNKSLIRLITIPKVEDDCCLCFAQYPDTILFKIKRVYYIYQAKPNLPRGSHAHYKTEQILFCLKGSIRIVLDDGRIKEEVVLKNPETGVYLDKKIWHEMHDFQEDTILLVLASEVYKKKDYIRDYQKFLKIVKKDEKN